MAYLPRRTLLSHIHVPTSSFIFINSVLKFCPRHDRDLGWSTFQILAGGSLTFLKNQLFAGGSSGISLKPGSLLSPHPIVHPSCSTVKKYFLYSDVTRRYSCRGTVLNSTTHQYFYMLLYTPLYILTYEKVYSTV